MKTYKYKEENGNEIFGNRMDDVENVSFRNTMIKFHASSIVPIIKISLERDKNCLLPYNDNIISLAALKIATQLYDEFAEEKVDKCFKSIFGKELNRKEQVQLLKGVQLKKTQLLSLFNYAEKKGYSFSYYRFQGESKSLKDEKLPSFMYLKKDGSIEYVGETTLTEGQMKMLIDQADVLIVRIFDNGVHWHCFLQTYKGLKGKESGVQGSRPHLHYISDAFGVSKDNLVSMIKMGRYPRTPVHIPLLEV